MDFFYFKLINFPVFNVADIYVTLSAVFPGDPAAVLNTKKKI
ncbi:MAG: signal peptidase II [Eubacterium ramulus]